MHNECQIHAFVAGPIQDRAATAGAMGHSYRGLATSRGVTSPRGIGAIEVTRRPVTLRAA